MKTERVQRTPENYKITHTTLRYLYKIWVEYTNFTRSFSVTTICIYSIHLQIKLYNIREVEHRWIYTIHMKVLHDDVVMVRFSAWTFCIIIMEMRRKYGSWKKLAKYIKISYFYWLYLTIYDDIRPYFKCKI